jgi:hypothetical protein
VAAPLIASSWTNALAFGPLAFKPSLESAKPYRATVATSFVTATVRWLAVAAIATRRRAAQRHPPQ